MDPKLQAALPWIIQQMQAQGSADGFQAARELQQYLQSGGHTPLSQTTVQLSGHLFTALGLPLPGQATPAPGPAPQAQGQAPATATPAPQAGPTAAPAGPQQGPISLTPPPAASTGGVRAGNFANSPGAPAYATDPRNSGMPMAQETGGDNPFVGTPGMSGEAGTSAGQAAAAAAQAGVLAAQRAASAGANGNLPTGSGSSTVPGGFTTAQGDVLAGNNDALMNFAMRAAGFNPDIVTPASKVALQRLGALVQARRAAYGLGNPGQDTSGLPQDIASFAKEYTTPGVDFYRNAANYAQGILGSQDFQQALGGVKNTEDQFAMMQALVPLLYGGANPMIQQSIADQLGGPGQIGGIYGKYLGDQISNPTGGGILDFIRSRPDLSPALRSIFGPQR